jgi:hypothetical protein
MPHPIISTLTTDVISSCEYWMTNWLTHSMEQSPSWEADQSLQLVKKFPAFYGTRRFVTVLTSARHLSLSWANSIQSPRPPPTSLRSILILASHLRLGHPSGLFSSGFPTNTLCTPLSSPICTTCPTHLILLNLTTHTILGKEYRSFSSSLGKLGNFLRSPVTLSLLGPNTQHRILKQIQPAFLPQC